MDTSDIDTQIKHYEQTLKNVRIEYDKSMIHEWSKIREKKLYFIKEIARLKKLQKDKMVSSIQERNTSCMESRRNISWQTPIKSNDPKSTCTVTINNPADSKPAIEANKIENIEPNSLSDDELKMTNDTLDLKSEMMNQVDCKHDWIRGKGDYNIKCVFCIYYPSQDYRVTCSACFKQTCIECLKSKNYNWRMEVELESEKKILASRVRTLENRMNKFEVEFEELKSKVEYNNIKQKGVVIKNNEQMITIRDHKGDKLIQLKDSITSFGSKYIVKFPFKDILGIRIPIKIVLKPNISYKLLALLDIGCTKNIIHDKYFARCPELVTTIDDDKAEVSTDMSGTKKLHNQIAYNIDTYINGTKYIIDEVTIRDLSLINDDMIIGLKFLQYYISGLILT